MKEIIQALENAKNSLTEENYYKGNFFSAKNDLLCMCPHGAVQAQVNPEVKKFVNGYTSGFIDAADAAREAANAAGSRAADAARSADAAVRDNWDTRPTWVREYYVYADKEYGTLDAHYLMGMVGLTISFSDAKETTLTMVKEKFDQAIQLAKELDQERPIVQDNTIFIGLKGKPTMPSETTLFLQLEAYVRVSTGYPNSVVGNYAATQIPHILKSLDELRGYVFDTEASAKDMALKTPQ